MKKTLVFILCLFSPVVLTAQEVIAIEAVQESLDKIKISWRSPLPTATFSIYYNDKMIDNQFKLFESDLIVNSNFIGLNVGETYQYEYVFTPKRLGDHFFAVTGIDVPSIDQRARTIFNGIDTKIDIRMTPELNATLQPIVVTHVQRNQKKSQSIKSHRVNTPLLTSLELQSREDVFNLRWNVYPKDLSEYVFTIYRSKYPIIQYGRPQGLPEYAVVTNQFSFEDRNIGFETPYYYAVVAEKSSQWDPGINVFSQPAILLRKSPPFVITPTIEYVKKQEPLSLNIEYFSEEEIEQAVQQTLSNMYLIAGVEPQERTVGDILAPTVVNTLQPSMKLSNITETPVFLYRENNTIKLDNISGIDQEFIEQKEQVFNSFLSDLDKQKKELIQKEYSNIGEISVLKEDICVKIQELKDIEEQLLHTDTLSLEQLKERLNMYYEKKAQIAISQHRMKGILRNIPNVRASQKKDFLNSQYALSKSFEQKIQQLEQNNNTAKYNKFVQSKGLFIEQIDKQIIELTNNILKSVDYLDNYRSSRKLNTITKDVILQASKADAKRGSTLHTFVETNNDNVEKYAQIVIAKNKKVINNLLSKRKLIISSNLVLDPPRGLNVIGKAYDVSGIIDNNVKEIQSYYRDVTTEEVPDIKTFTNEKWLVIKDDWVRKNKKTWDRKQNLWKRRAQEILGEDYWLISSKWMNPSKHVALQEGRRAFEQKNYKEAIYLLNFVSTDPNALMALGQSYYHLGAYRDAFTVFIVARHMAIPESHAWIDRTTSEILGRDI